MSKTVAAPWTIASINDDGYCVIAHSDSNAWSVTNTTVHHDPSDVIARLTVIESILEIPERNGEMERKHPHLTGLFDDYIQSISVTSSKELREKYEKEMERMQVYETLNKD